MADHRGPVRPTRLVPAVVLLLVAAVLLLGGQGTSAYWTDDTPANAGSISSGSLDVKLGSSASGPFTDDLTLSTFGIADMLPGDSRATAVVVRNASDTARLQYAVRATAPTADLASSLRVEIWTGATASTSGDATTGYTGTCTGGTQVVAATAPTTAGVNLTSTPIGPVAPAGNSSLCVRVSLVGSAPVTAQNKTTTITLTFSARSVAR